MRQLQKDTQSKTCPSTLIAEMIVSGKKEWRMLSCPLTAEPYGRTCGEVCAWYAEETVGGALGVPVQVVVSCQGRPIGSLVTE